MLRYKRSFCTWLVYLIRWRSTRNGFFLIGEQSHSDTVIQVGEEARTDVVLHVEFNAFINACTFEYVPEPTLVVYDESRETGLQVDFLPAVHVIVLAGSPFHPNARCETVILRPYGGL